MPKELGGTDDFKPSEYLTSLIATINDEAKSAQGSAILFLLVGLYLLATAVGVSDEDLLLGRTVTIAQIGATVPVVFSFAIAPMVFVFLHIYALVRYDMLAGNLRQFRKEVREFGAVGVPPRALPATPGQHRVRRRADRPAWLGPVQPAVALAVQSHRRVVPGSGRAVRADKRAALPE